MAAPLVPNSGIKRLSNTIPNSRRKKAKIERSLGKPIANSAIPRGANTN